MLGHTKRCILSNIRDLDFPRVERSYRDSAALDGTGPASTISRLGLPLDPAALWSCGSCNLCQSMAAATGAFIHRTDYHLNYWVFLASITGAGEMRPLRDVSRLQQQATRTCHSPQTMPQGCPRRVPGKLWSAAHAETARLFISKLLRRLTSFKTRVPSSFRKIGVYAPAF